MARSGPPAYAWDWFARQRLPWREARNRLTVGEGTRAARYGSVEVRGEVLALLRADYPRDEVVRGTVHDVVREVVFLGRGAEARFADLGIRSAPRGLRWWWSALTGEEVDAPTARRSPAAEGRDAASGPGGQLSLDDVLGGYGDGPPA